MSPSHDLHFVCDGIKKNSHLSIQTATVMSFITYGYG